MKRDDLLEVEEGELCMIGHWSVVKSDELSSRYALSPPLKELLQSYEDVFQEPHS